MVSPLQGSLAKTIYKSFKSIFLDATLTRDGANSGEPYDPTVASPAVYTCKAIAETNTAGTQGTGLEGVTGLKVLILAQSLAVTPEPLDRISIPAQGINGLIYDPQSIGKSTIATDPAQATWSVVVT